MAKLKYEMEGVMWIEYVKKGRKKQGYFFACPWLFDEEKGFTEIEDK